MKAKQQRRMDVYTKKKEGLERQIALTEPGRKKKGKNRKEGKGRILSKQKSKSHAHPELQPKALRICTGKGEVPGEKKKESTKKRQNGLREAILNGTRKVGIVKCNVPSLWVKV